MAAVLMPCFGHSLVRRQAGKDGRIRADAPYDFFEVTSEPGAALGFVKATRVQATELHVGDAALVHVVRGRDPAVDLSGGQPEVDLHGLLESEAVAGGAKGRARENGHVFEVSNSEWRPEKFLDNVSSVPLPCT